MQRAEMQKYFQQQDTKSMYLIINMSWLKLRLKSSM